MKTISKHSKRKIPAKTSMTHIPSFSHHAKSPLDPAAVASGKASDLYYNQQHLAQTSKVLRLCWMSKVAGSPDKRPSTFRITHVQLPSQLMYTHVTLGIRYTHRRHLTTWQSAIDNMRCLRSSISLGAVVAKIHSPGIRRFSNCRNLWDICSGKLQICCEAIKLNFH